MNQLNNTLVIIVTCIIACGVIYYFPSGEAKEILLPIITGLFGIATGYSMAMNHKEPKI